MAGLVPGIHVFDHVTKRAVDAWDKPGHDTEARQSLFALPILRAGSCPTRNAAQHSTRSCGTVRHGR